MVLVVHTCSNEHTYAKSETWGSIALASHKILLTAANEFLTGDGRNPYDQTSQRRGDQLNGFCSV